MICREELARVQAARAARESGAALATRALGWGTLAAFSGCGILFYTVWRLVGVDNLAEFRIAAGNILPRIPKNPPKPGERTEFSGINDFLRYIIQKDEEEKLIKKQSSVSDQD